MIDAQRPPAQQKPNCRLKRVLLAGLVFLAACRGPAAALHTPVGTSSPSIRVSELPPTGLPATEAVQERPEELPSEPAVERSTAVFMPAAELEQAESPAALAPAADPLQFVFPTPGPAPVSAWRPPLYPTPWAPTPYDHFYFARPIGADNVNWPLEDYRYGGVFFADIVHTGVDIPAAKGTPVLAAGPGKVTWTGYGLYAQKEDPDDPYGLAVAIRHDFGHAGETLYTVYGHLSKIVVARGQKVETGDLLGLVGETGKVTGPHLHFEVRVGKNNFFGSRNPELWMSPPQGWGVLVARLMTTTGVLLERQSIKVLSHTTGQVWDVKSYGDGSTNSDPYYRENLVMGDLPAGKYEVQVPYAGVIYNLAVDIRPGLTSYFTFRGKNGFKTDLPSAPGWDFSPP